jgi:hypothetical protein
LLAFMAVNIITLLLNLKLEAETFHPSTSGTHTD